VPKPVIIGTRTVGIHRHSALVWVQEEDGRLMESTLSILSFMLFNSGCLVSVSCFRHLRIFCFVVMAFGNLHKAFAIHKSG
jgi:hypothetical protein